MSHKSQTTSDSVLVCFQGYFFHPVQGFLILDTSEPVQHLIKARFCARKFYSHSVTTSMKTFQQFLTEHGLFSMFQKPQQQPAEVNRGLSSPEANKAFEWIMRRYHGANIEELKELQNPNFPMWLMRKFGLSPHDVREPLEAAWSDLTGQDMP
jgi:hypothetical protein